MALGTGAYVEIVGVLPKREVGPRKRCLGSAGGYRKVWYGARRCVPQRPRAAERLHVVKPDVLKTSPQRCVRSLRYLSRRTGGFGNGVGMDGTGDIWMLIPSLPWFTQVRHVVKTPFRPQCYR